MIRKLFCTIAVLLVAAMASAQQDFSRVEIKTIHVAKNIYMLQGAGGNIGVSVGPDGILIVDDQFAPLAEKIEAALKELNPGKLKFVLNTHFHGDHTGGNAHFGHDAHIIAHSNVRRQLGGDTNPAKAGLPIITFDDSLHVHFNGEEIHLIHVPPAHTDSDSVIYFKGANVIHFGDTFFSGRFPNIDLGGGGDVRGYIQNVADSIQKVPADAKLIPGHGPLSTVKELKEFHEMLVETSSIVQQAIDAGKTLDEAKAAGLPDKWKSWAAPTLGTSRWIELLYKGLSKKSK
ncbi:MAG TPA: MBL fold metallo-hydrolase [Candidatus Saccharimonadales bacterium]|nr:MBL fold metallo-hydrolase [Candidatus Saccharimonadales bacterium]